MRCAAAVSLAVTVLISAGCELNPKPKVAAVPPPPVAAPPPPPAPLVIPQNTAKVPTPQPIPPDAIPAQPPGGLAMAAEPEVPALRPATPRTTPTVTPAPRIEAQTPPPAEVPAAPLPPARQPSTLMSRTDRTRNRAIIEERVRQVRGVLSQLDRQNFTGAAKDDRDRANSMIDLAQQALKRSDLRQADELSSRAAILANTLINAR